jgi:hypothetical protein
MVHCTNAPYVACAAGKPSADDNQIEASQGFDLKHRRRNMTKILAALLTVAVLSSTASAVMAAPVAHPELSREAAQARGDAVAWPQGSSPRVDIQ